jgi:hypothetical protein
MNLLPHARHAEEDRGAHFRQVRHQRLDALGKVDLVTDRDVVVDRAQLLGDMGQRQVGDQPVVGR